MPSTLLSLNTSNYVQNETATYSLSFEPTQINNAYVSLDSLSLYNSIFNITAKYGNNQFSIQWIDGTVYNFTIPDSYLEYDALNAYIEQQCLLNNLYMLDTNSNNVFFFNISSNLNRYKVELDVYYVPNSSTASALKWTVPSGATWSLPVNNTTPQIFFNAGLQIVTGLTQNTYLPPSPLNTNYQVFSISIPKLLQVFNILVSCNLVYNDMNNQNKTILAQIPIKSSFGSLITTDKTSMNKLPVRAGAYNSITIKLLDNDFNPLQINDTDFSISILLERD